ncbi:MAG: GGDEF domain-containing protein [bacterium]|nr:GGDEF domain-containing protein [bacterium]
MSRHDGDSTIALEGQLLAVGRLRKSHASLIVLQGAEIGRDFRLRKTGTIVGRSLEVDIRVPDEGASRQHARIDRDWDGKSETTSFVITDLKSTNRTLVNSVPVESVELRDGDKIQIGGTLLKFVILDDVDAKFHSEVRDRITYDQLTGLLTKESLYLALDAELRRCRKYEMPLAVLMMDLDRFKSVNDGHGHLMGSHVLTEIGELIRASIRVADVSARYGGEEFVSYLAEVDSDGALPVAERIRAAVESHAFTLGGTTIGVTISIGVGHAPLHGQDLNSLVGAADRALYRAKQTGRNRVCVAD